MQTILVPIDFTAASDNALVYANKLALRLPAEIVLVHAGTGPATTLQQREALLHRLEALAERLRYQQLTRQSGRRISYHFHLAAEPLADCLQKAVAGFQASLVVTGLALSDCAAATASGSPITLLPERVSCPVLMVPPGHHELPAQVVVSADFERLAAPQLASLAGFSSRVGAHFHLVQFHLPTSAGLAPLKKALLAAAAQLPAATTHLVADEDALEGLSEFCARQQAQLLVLGTTDGCLVRRFFNPHYAKTNAYHLRIPTLLLPTSTEPTAACCAQCGLRQAAATRLITSSVPTASF